ncbi:MAG: hypothetical protein KC877_00440 [Candidatus Kaiserbacteria bacterium]|nr:hypothetical protein [Candidatus Kaiserbacteria bacterium]MCB9816019.1 hypothetical protein [Candidatus Nomurabacteria bacterium]
MSFFGLGKPSDRYGVIIDVGSGSVLTAIVHSSPKQKHPQIVWSQREHAPLRNVDSLEQSAKAVMTALVNSSMLLDTEGRTALREYNPDAKLTELQCSISAPWSYTVTKTINYKQEKPFTITEELIEELTHSLQQKIDNEIRENEAMQNLGLQVITRATMDSLSNGYRVEDPIGEEAKEFSISQGSVVAQNYLIDALDEMRDKLFPTTTGKKLSFILMLFSVTRELLPKTYDICLVDVTYEATEIGVVRDGTLSYCTHTPFGSFSLAREISAITNVPLHEAFGYLHTDKPLAFMEALSAEQRKGVDAAIEAYIEKLSALFRETGDALSIPKKISLHADLKSEPLFTGLIMKAAKRNLKSEPIITPISGKIIEMTYAESTKKTTQVVTGDTALLLSAQFFHKRKPRETFEYF